MFLGEIIVEVFKYKRIIIGVFVKLLGKFRLFVDDLILGEICLIGDIVEVLEEIIGGFCVFWFKCEVFYREFVIKIEKCM